MMVLISQAELSVCDVLLWKRRKTKNVLLQPQVFLFYSMQCLSVDICQSDIKLTCMWVK